MTHSDNNPAQLATQLTNLARVEAEARRRAKKAVTDLAEAVDDALRAGQSLENISLWTGWNLQDLEILLAAEAARIYNRRYNRDRWRRIKAGEIPPAHGSSEGVALGCTCEECDSLRQSQRARERAKKAAGLPPGDPRHGTPSARWRYGCDCELCATAAAAAYSSPEVLRARRQRRAGLPPEELAALREKDALRKRQARLEKRQTPV